MVSRWGGRERNSSHNKIGSASTDPMSRLRSLKPRTRRSHKDYFLGTTQETTDALLNEIIESFPHAKVVGYECLPFRPPTAAELERRDQKIKDSGATAVWVGLGTPKQDFEVQRLDHKLPVTAMAVGAAFDFLAQKVPQVPKWIQKCRGLRGVTDWHESLNDLQNATSGNHLIR